MVKNIDDLLTTYALEKFFPKFRKKFNSFSDDDIRICTKEVIRYLILCSISKRDLFFPGDYLIDEIWHSFITETEFYEEFCSKLGMSGIIHHSGVLYEDYQKEITPEALHEEQLSWLASYILNFGDMTEESFSHLPMAKGFCNRLDINLEKLNALGKSLVEAMDKAAATKKAISWKDLMQELHKIPYELDKSVDQVSDSLASIFEINRAEQKDSVCLMSNTQLRDLFKASASLGFTTWQHLAAVERLSERKPWQEANKFLWNNLSKGLSKIGLATTHIGNVIPVLAGEKTEDGYNLKGKIPWVSGIDIFDCFVVGFQSNNQNIFAVVNVEDLKFSHDIKIHKHKLAAYNSSCTAMIDIQKLQIKEYQIISVTDYGTSSRLTKSRYTYPETGIARRALLEATSLLEIKQFEDSDDIRDTISKLYEKIENYEYLIESENEKDEIELQLKRDVTINNSIRLLVLMEKGSALKENSIARLLNTQVLLLDVFVQADELVKRKINSLKE